MAKLVSMVLSMLETCFWCLSPGCWAWEIDWDHFRPPQIGQSGRNGHFRPFMATQMAKLVIMVLSMLEMCFWCLSPGCWAWEIYWDHFQPPQIGQNDPWRPPWSPHPPQTTPLGLLTHPRRPTLVFSTTPDDPWSPQFKMIYLIKSDLVHNLWRRRRRRTKHVSMVLDASKWIFCHQKFFLGSVYI